MPVFLVTDIEGSTQLWEQHRHAMGQALIRHDAILKSEIEQHGGRIIKHTGDGVFAVFDEGQPLDCALAIQRRFGQERWRPLAEVRLRIALHAGEAEKRGDDYFGLVVNRTARLLPIGWGGQILLTPAVAALAALPAAATLTDMGNHLLQDLTEPQAVYMLRRPDLPHQEFPPLRSLSMHNHNLPLQPTPFIGREAEQAAIRAQLADRHCRLINLIGPGGMGKTRLALQVAAGQIIHFAHGVYFISVVEVKTPELAVPVIAQALHLSFYGQQPTKIQLLDHLRDKSMLLIMDSFEQLVLGAGLLTDILQCAPQIKLLVTSRERLKLVEESVFRVQGMSFPKPESNDRNREQLVRSGWDVCDAAQLFVQAARRVRPDFVLTDHDKAAVMRICYLLDGMPLAIELASAWVRMLTCSEIAQEIEANFDFLTTSKRNVLHHQYSMRAVFDYTWTFLAEPERAAVRRLSVFRGAFQAEAAQQLAGVSALFLASLVDKALIRQVDAHYQMHELLRQYAAEKLSQLPLEYATARRAHALYYAEFLERRHLPLRTAEQKNALAEIGAEIDNARTAWQWIFEQLAVQPDDEEALTAVGQSLDSLYLFYEIRGWFQEGEQMFATAVASLRPFGSQPPANDQKKQSLTRLLARQALFCYHQGIFAKTQELLEESLTLACQIESLIEEAFSLNHLGLLAYSLGQLDAAETHFRASLTIFEETEEVWGGAVALNRLGNVYYMRGQFAEARRMYSDSLALCREVGFQSGIADALNNLGNVASSLGNYDLAEKRLRESLAIYQEIGFQKRIATTFNNLAHVASMQGHYERAKALYEQCLAIYSRIGERSQIAFSQKNLGDVALASGEFLEARRYYQKSLALYQEIDDTRNIAFSSGQLGDVARSLGHYDEANDFYQQALALFEQGGYQDGLAHTLENLGLLAAFQKNYEEARQFYHKSLAVHLGVGNQEGIGHLLNRLGEVALAAGNHEMAAQYFHEGLAVCMEASLHFRVAATHCNLAEVALASHDLAEARRHYLLALEMAIGLQTPRLILATLVSFTTLLLGNGADAAGQRALQLLILCRDHPASDQETRDRAIARLQQFEAGHVDAVTLSQASRDEAPDIQEIASLILKGGW
jgi:predicted ATPase/class 3 adenylate cyclase/uncharacterized protein HemY